MSAQVSVVQLRHVQHVPKFRYPNILAVLFAPMNTSLKPPGDSVENISIPTGMECWTLLDALRMTTQGPL